MFIDRLENFSFDELDEVFSAHCNNATLNKEIMNKIKERINNNKPVNEYLDTLMVFGNCHFWDIYVYDKFSGEKYYYYWTLFKDLKPISDMCLPALVNNEVKYIFHNEQYVVVGDMANGGLNPQFWIPKDEAFSIDEHLQAIHELIIESETELNGLIEF